MWGSEHPVKRLKDVLHQVRRPEKPSPHSVYNLVGVRLYAGGARIQGTFSGATLQAPSLNRVEEGDIIYNKMWASKGTFALISKEISHCYSTSEYPAFRSSDDHSSEYIFRVLSQPRFWLRAEAWSLGSTDRTRLNPADFLSLPMPVPAPAEQRAIAEVLGAVDAAIAKTVALIEATAQTTTKLLKQYFLDHQKALKWSCVGKMGRWKSGGTPATSVEANWTGSVPWVCPKDIKAPTVSSTIDQISEQAARALGIVDPGTLLLVVRGMILVRAVPSTICSVPCAFNQDVKAFVPNKGVLPAFLKLWLDINEHKLLAEIETATHGTKRFPSERLNDFAVPVVSLDEQIRLVAVAQCSQERLRSENASLSALHDARDALTQELLSGRVRLPDSMVARYRDKAGQAA